jgi:hypothetical protein
MQHLPSFGRNRHQFHQSCSAANCEALKIVTGAERDPDDRNKASAYSEVSEIGEPFTMTGEERESTRLGHSAARR